MATFLENLIAARDQVAAHLVTISTNPKPNYKIDGQSVSWQSLFDSYTRQLASLNALIATAEPAECESWGVPE